MENYNSFEKLIKNDKLPFSANPGIEQRLMYHFQLKTSSSKIKKNHIIPFLDGIFSSRFIGLKIACAVVIIAVAVGFKQFNAPERVKLQADTASVLTIHDSLKLIYSSDSVSVN